MEDTFIMHECGTVCTLCAALPAFVAVPTANTNQTLLLRGWMGIDLEICFPQLHPLNSLMLHRGYLTVVHCVNVKKYFRFHDMQSVHVV